MLFRQSRSAGALLAQRGVVGSSSRLTERRGCTLLFGASMTCILLAAWAGFLRSEGQLQTLAQLPGTHAYIETVLQWRGSTDYRRPRWKRSGA